MLGRDPIRLAWSCSGSPPPAHPEANCGRDIPWRQQELVLRGIDRLALDVAIRGPRQHVRGAGELAIALVDFVGFISRDHKEGDAVADFGRPDVLLVEAKIDRGLRRVIPDQPVAAAGNEEWNADILSTDGGVIMPAIDSMVAQVESTLLLLAESIVVLAGRRIEGGGNAIPGVRLLLLCRVAGVASGFVRNHGPPPHGQQRFAGRGGYVDGVVVRSMVRRRRQK